MLALFSLLHQKMKEEKEVLCNCALSRLLLSRPATFPGLRVVPSHVAAGGDGHRSQCCGRKEVFTESDQWKSSLLTICVSVRGTYSTEHSVEMGVHTDNWIITFKLLFVVPSSELLLLSCRWQKKIKVFEDICRQALKNHCKGPDTLGVFLCDEQFERFESMNKTLLNSVQTFTLERIVS